MSSIGDPSTYMCDRCGVGVGNGGISLCMVVSDLDPEDTGMVRNLHFCRINGCVGKVLSNRNMQAYLERRSKAALDVAEHEALLEKVASLEEENRRLSQTVSDLRQ